MLNPNDKTVVSALPAALKSKLLAAQNSETEPKFLTFGDGKGVNPLVNAAAPLLLLMAELKQAQDCADIEKLRRELVKEVKNFEIKARAQKVSEVTLLVARYLVCAALDETLLKLLQDRNDLWAKQSLLTIFHRDAGGGEKFFAILDKLNQDPGLNQDSLELASVCLELGFEGKYRVTQDGQRQLAAIKMNLSKRIAQARNQHGVELNVDIQPQKTPKPLGINIPFMRWGLMTLGVLLGIYIVFAIGIQIRGLPTIHVLEKIEKTTDSNK